MVSQQVKQHRPAAFSIPEMLAVIAIVVIILSLLMPALSQSRRTAWVAVCASNQHTIFQAFINFRNQGKMASGQPSQLAAGSWPLSLHEHFGKEGSIAECPEDTAAASGGTSSGGATGGFYVNGGSSYPGGISRTYDMQDGPLHRKLSQTQYENIIAAHGDGDGSWRPYFQPGGGYAADGGYKDDGQPILWLVIEDNVNASGQPAGDQDFNDVQIKIEYQPDGSTIIKTKKASAGRYWLTYGENRELLFPEQNNGELGWGWYGPLELNSASASYGMNSYVNGSTGGKIMLMDYVKTTVLPETDNWAGYRDEGGNLRFARHVNRRVNVLSRDGSVQTADPEDLNPIYSQIRTDRWLP